MITGILNFNNWLKVTKLQRHYSTRTNDIMGQILTKLFMSSRKYVSGILIYSQRFRSISLVNSYLKTLRLIFFWSLCNFILQLKNWKVKREREGEWKARESSKPIRATNQISEDLHIYLEVQRNAVKALLTTRRVHIQKWTLWFSLYKKFLYALLMKNVQNGVLETKTWYIWIMCDIIQVESKNRTLRYVLCLYQGSVQISLSQNSHVTGIQFRRLDECYWLLRAYGVHS